MCEALERVERGELKRLIVEMPPRHGKSEVVSVNFPPFAMGKNRNRNIMEASYAAGLSEDFGRQVRNIMSSTEYGVLFPNTKLSQDSTSKGSWSTNGRGNYNAMGVGGTATGKGADFLIIDDPIKNREEADSETVSEAIWSWYKSTARTRLSPEGAIIIVMTRWKDDDLVGRVLAQDPTGWEVISYPAIAEEDEKFRKEGEALWANHFTKENLLQTKADIGSYEFSALYQQDPVSRDDAEFKPHWFKQIEMEEVMRKQTSCYITIDSALSKKKTSDYTGITINWVDTENVWYLKSYRIKISSTELLDTIFDLHRAYKPEAIGLEETVFTQAIQPFLTIEMAKRNIFPNVIDLKHGGSAKDTRIRGLIPRYERGHIFHIADMCLDLESELLRFPSSKHDDTMDSAAYQAHIAKAPYFSEPEPPQEEERSLYPQVMGGK